ncbi:hypothetical protein [Streptomyces sp. NBC_00212]|uniref:hypothetical protein n=1 Tax=Streptomyces sp. NBC_00212 TaxID=2975684 RepID=UPI003248A338
MSKQPSRTLIYEVAPATDAEFARLRQEVLASLCAPKRVTAEAASEPPTPAPAEDAPAPMWTLPPQEFSAIATAALWPQADHQWVPRPPMTLEQYLKDGI